MSITKHILPLFFQTRSRLRNHSDTVSLLKTVNVEKRLLAIPILYIVIRIWGTLQFFYSLIVSGSNDEGCIPSTVKTVYIVFGILQVRVAIKSIFYYNYFAYDFLLRCIKKCLYTQQ